MYRRFLLTLLILLLTCSLTPISSVYAAEPGVVSATGQSVTRSTTGNDTQSITQTAASQALTRYKANGGVTPKVVIVFHTISDPNSVILPTIQSVFGSNVPVVGMDASWWDYVPISLDAFPPNDTDRSIVILALGGTSISITTGIGTTDFSNTTPSIVANAGTMLARSLSPNPTKKNLILMFGPLHVPNNSHVVSGIQSVWGKPLPQSTRIIGWAGPYWGSQVYQNGTKSSSGTTVMGVMISGNFQWAFSGASHDPTWGVSNDPSTEITRQTLLVSTAVGGHPAAIFMVPGHPDKPLFPGIRNALVAALPANTPLFGMHQGSETGHDTTAGDVIADADHFFVAAIAPETGVPTATPTVCTGDINGDRIVDLSDYSILVRNFLKSPLTNTAADLNGDTIVDLSDYSILVRAFFKSCS